MARAAQPKPITDRERDAAYDAMLTREIRAGGIYRRGPIGSSGLRQNIPSVQHRAEYNHAVATLEEYDQRQRDLEFAGANVTRSEMAWRTYLRTGVAESRDLSAGALTGYLVPRDIEGELIWGAQYFSAVLQRARLWKSVGPDGRAFGGPAQLPSVAADVSVTASQIAENTQRGETDLSFGMVSFSNAPTYTGGLMRFGRALMQDSAQDVSAMVVNALAERLGRQLDLDFCATILAGASNVVTTATNAAIVVADISALAQKLDGAHFGAENTALIVSPKTRWYLQTQLVDSSLRPLMGQGEFVLTTEDTTAEGGSRTRTVSVPKLFGIPVVTSPALSDIGASANVAILANLNAAFVWRYVEASVIRLTERYADYGQIGFDGYARQDGAIAVNAGALAVLKMHS